MFALWMAVRELKIIARRLGAGMPEPRGEITVRPVLPPGPCGRVRPAMAARCSASREPRAWAARNRRHRRHGRTRPRRRAPELSRPGPPRRSRKAKRNLLFSSTSRKERERAQARTSEPLPPDLLSADIRPNPADAPPPAEPAEPPPASFDDAWPKPERGRAGRHSAAAAQRTAATRARAQRRRARTGDQPAVTVLKSGVVDGMAYSLYSDGSIEAQMPEGMMRFASIDELRAHLDQRP